MITLNLYICEDCKFLGNCDNKGRSRVQLNNGKEVIATCKCQKERQYDWSGRKLSPDKEEVTIYVPIHVNTTYCFSLKSDLKNLLDDLGFVNAKQIDHHEAEFLIKTMRVKKNKLRGFSEVFVNGASIGKGTFVWDNDAI